MSIWIIHELNKLIAWNSILNWTQWVHLPQPLASRTHCSWPFPLGHKTCKWQVQYVYKYSMYNHFSQPISQQWPINNIFTKESSHFIGCSFVIEYSSRFRFPRRGEPTVGGGTNLLFDSIFPESCMRIKKSGLEGRASLRPLNLPM